MEMQIAKFVSRHHRQKMDESRRVVPQVSLNRQHLVENVVKMETLGGPQTSLPTTSLVKDGMKVEPGEYTPFR